VELSFNLEQGIVLQADAGKFKIFILSLSMLIQTNKHTPIVIAGIQINRVVLVYNLFMLFYKENITLLT
jgi:hypothetical protein